MVMLCKKIEKVDLPLYLSSWQKDGRRMVAEEKMDGDRIILSFKGNKLSLLNRKGIEVTEKYPELHNFGKRLIEKQICDIQLGCSLGCINLYDWIKVDWTEDLPFKLPTYPIYDYEIVLDGELCVMRDGKSQFNEGIAFRTHCEDALKIKEASEKYPVTYVVFDILELISPKGAGSNLRNMRLEDRRTILVSLSNELKHKHIQIINQSNDIIGLWKEVTSKAGEGIVIKDLDSRYYEKRTDDWLKVKDVQEEDLIFTKYTTHNKGIRCTTDNDIAITVNGNQSYEVAKEIDTKGRANITIRHMGETANHRYRMPVFLKMN